MPKSTKSRGCSKPVKRYNGFPLFSHATGQCAKTIQAEIHFFGRFGYVQADTLGCCDVGCRGLGAVQSRMAVSL